MDAVLDDHVPTECSPADLQAARNRIAELEAELRHLQTAPSVAEPTSYGPSLAQMRLSDVEAWLVKRAMERAQGNVSRAARALGLSRAALYRRLERHAVNRSL
jgi:transcriptional regulator of acetoin/glycerol metabolism